MKNMIILILAFVACVFGADKNIRTFALCTNVKGIDYCAVSGSKATISYDSSIARYTLTSTTEEVYTYDIEQPTTAVTMTASNAKVNDVSETINGAPGKQYVAIETQHTFVLVDNLTSCYIKKYFEGTPDIFYQSFKFITINVSDFFGFYSQCVAELQEND